MKTNKLFATLMLVLICAGMYTAKAQTVIVADSFRNKTQAPDTTAVSVALPTGWVANNKYNTWVYNNIKTGTITTNASSSGKVAGNVTFAFSIDANQSDVPRIAVDSIETVTSPSLCSTTGYKSVYITWVSRISSAFQGANMDSTTVWWSTDAKTWNKIAYHLTYVASASAYYIQNGDTPISLPAAAAGASGLYLQWRTDVNGKANGNYQFTDIVITGSTATGINDVLYASNPKVTAFSANNLLHLQFSNTNGAEATVSVYDMSGKTMLTQNVVSSSDQTININNFAPGIYTTRVIVAGQAFTSKFAK